MAVELAVKLNGVSKSYGGHSIFRDLSLKMEYGVFAVMMGKNGAGKSTLMRLIAGLEACDAGELNVLGSDLESENLNRRQTVAYVSEQIALDPRYVLSKAIEACLPFYPNWDQSLFDRFVMSFGLNLTKRFGGLSRGQKVQFLFAIAAASKPKIFLLDEVTSVLDANARFEVMSHLKNEVSKGASVLLATNIAAEAHNYANEIVLLNNGRIGLQCSDDELQARFTKFRLHADTLQLSQFPKEARPVQLNRDGSVSYLIPSVPAHPIASVEKIDQRGVTIEDVFVYFTGPENTK